MGRRRKDQDVRQDQVSSAQRGFRSISVTARTKQRFLDYCGARRADDVLLSLLDGAGASTPAGDFDWDGLRLALKQRLKLANPAVLAEVLKEYGMPSE